MDLMALELKTLFLDANDKLLNNDILLFKSEVSERTICGALMNKIYDELKNSNFFDYYVDVEYNRNTTENNRRHIKTCCVRDGISDTQVIDINCDLIVHSRGQNIQQDNLIALEMKKSGRPQQDKDDDRNRLIALTKDSFDDVWSFDGTILPEHVCRYKLGIYYEINFINSTISLEYYYKGEKIGNPEVIDLKDKLSE